MLTRPVWFDVGIKPRAKLGYVWDDTRAMLDFAGDAAPVLRAAMKMSLRARMVLCMGLYEWSVWRFEGLHNRSEVLDIAEAGWCATVDPRYMKFFELPRHLWVGPVEGPLWCAAMWLQPAMSKGHQFPKELYEALSFLTRLALHVLPDTSHFLHWLSATLDRLVTEFPLQPDDPFADLFGREPGLRLGPLIGRNALDPDHAYTPAQALVFFEDTLRDAGSRPNPFVATPSDLREAGFSGPPYILPQGLP